MPRVMGDLSGTGEKMTGKDRIFLDHLNRRFRIKSPAGLNDPPPNFRIARDRKPWGIYRTRRLTVLPAFFLMYTFLFLILGAVSLEPIAILSSSLCSLPLLYLIFRLQRPRIVHDSLAIHDSRCTLAHPLQEDP
ncbi:MAG: hypothetical protein MK168_04815, partial [Candidatus Thalassarchaeum sp.]|nr:hypothetical protein [Candidatus Thalassarchaeum sp.]